MHSFFKGLRLSLEHFVQVTRGVADLLTEASSEHSPQFSMPPLLLSLQARHFFLLSALSLGKYPVLQSSALTQDVAEVGLETVFRYRLALHSVYVAALVPGADNWSGLVHLTQLAMPV